MNISPVPSSSSRRSGSRRWLVASVFVAVSLITAIALLYAFENWRGKRAWEKYERDSAARGEMLDLRGLVSQPVTDEENFAATPLVRLWFSGTPANVTNRWPENVKNAATRLQNTQKSRAEWQLTDLAEWRVAFTERTSQTAPESSRRRRSGTNTVVSQRQPSSPEDRKEAAQFVLSHLGVYEPGLNEFRATVSRPRAYYPVQFDYEQPFAILLPHLAQIRSVMQVLNLRACAELAAGNNDGAFQDTMLGLRFVESLRDEPFLISQLVRVACLVQATQPIWEGMVQQRWTAEQLLAFQSRLDAMDFLKDLPSSMRLERAAGLATIDTVRRGRSAAMLSPQGNSDPAASAGISLAPSGWFYLEKLNYAQIFDVVLPPMEASDLGALRAVSAEVADELKGGLQAVWQHRAFAALLLPAFENAALKVAAAQTLVEQAATACALERARLETGAFPETLEALVPKYLKAPPQDLFTRAPMRYSRTATIAYLLYSVGADGKDNGGTPGKQMLDTTTGDWPWRVEPVINRE